MLMGELPSFFKKKDNAMKNNQKWITYKITS